MPEASSPRRMYHGCEWPLIHRRTSNLLITRYTRRISSWRKGCFFCSWRKGCFGVLIHVFFQPPIGLSLFKGEVIPQNKETEVGVRWSIYDWIRGWLLCRTWKIQPFFERNIFIIYLIFQTFIFGFLSCHEGWIVYKIMKVLIKSWQGLEDKIPGSSKCVFFFASPTKKSYQKAHKLQKHI